MIQSPKNSFNSFSFREVQVLDANAINRVLIGLKDRVELISIIVLLEVIANTTNVIIWIKRNLVRPNHECDRECAVSVEHLYGYFLSLYIWKSFH